MPTTPPDHAAFLAQHLPAQREPLACHATDGGYVWLRRTAAPAHPLQRGGLALAARLSHTPALRPSVPADGAAALDGLRTLAAHGLRVPDVLAQDGAGFLLRDPDGGARPCMTLDAALHAAAAEGAGPALALWRQGLALMDHAHAAGLSLGGAFAGDLLVCADGALACTRAEAIAAPLPAPELRQVRDALAYLWSTAAPLHQAGLREAARPVWREWVASPVRGEPFRGALAQHLSRLSWLRYLPPDSRWGSAIYQMRAAYEQAMAPRYGEAPADPS